MRKIVSDYCRTINPNTDRIFDAGTQQDACFFLLAVIDCLRAELGEDSVLLDSLVQGEVDLTFKCESCQEETVVTEIQPVMSLPIKGRTVPESIVDFYKTEDVTKTCEKCGHLASTVSKNLPYLPDVLFIQIKRFSFSLAGNNVKKIETRLKAPSILTLDGKCFELQSFLSHLGEDAAGHYTATVWDQSSSTYSLCNDLSISTGISEAKSCSNIAYVYCYVKTDNLEMMNRSDVVNSTPSDTPKRMNSIPKMSSKRQKIDKSHFVTQKLPGKGFGPDNPELLDSHKIKLKAIRENRNVKTSNKFKDFAKSSNSQEILEEFDLQSPIPGAENSSPHLSVLESMRMHEISDESTILEKEMDFLVENSNSVLQL